MSGRAVHATTSPIGTHANAIAGAAPGANTTFPAGGIQVWSGAVVSAFGHVAGATTLTLMYSADGANFYKAGTLVLAGAADFAIDVTTAAGWVALQSTNNVVTTATIQAK